jgi:hypothetical protein
MSTATWEEASRCPKCDQPGDDRKQTYNREKHATIHILYCVQKLCPWFDTAWFVQVNDDGSIPKEVAMHQPKQFPALSQEMITRIEEATQAQLRAETQPGTEIRNPKGN